MYVYMQVPHAYVPPLEIEEHHAPVAIYIDY